MGSFIKEKSRHRPLHETNKRGSQLGSLYYANIPTLTNVA